MEFYQLIGYFSGLLFIKPEMDATSVWRTATLVHLLDAILCGVIANHGGRNKMIWTMAGAVCGIWALGTLFLLPDKRGQRN